MEFNDDTNSYEQKRKSQNREAQRRYRQRIKQYSNQSDIQHHSKPPASPVPTMFTSSGSAVDTALSSAPYSEMFSTDDQLLDMYSADTLPNSVARPFGSPPLMANNEKLLDQGPGLESRHQSPPHVGRLVQQTRSESLDDLRSHNYWENSLLYHRGGGGSSDSRGLQGPPPTLRSPPHGHLSNDDLWELNTGSVGHHELETRFIHRPYSTNIPPLSPGSSHVPQVYSRTVSKAFQMIDELKALYRLAIEVHLLCQNEELSETLDSLKRLFQQSSRAAILRHAGR